jgi:hypothetical protein
VPLHVVPFHVFATNLQWVKLSRTYLQHGPGCQAAAVKKVRTDGGNEFVKEFSAPSEISKLADFAACLRGKGILGILGTLS